MNRPPAAADADLAARIARLASGAASGRADWTAGMQQWAAEGLAGLPALLPLLVQPDPLVRLRAQHVLEHASRDWVAQRVVERPLARRVDSAWLRLWQHNGPYDWQADAAHCADSARRWQDWLAAPSLPSDPDRQARPGID